MVQPAKRSRDVSELIMICSLSAKGVPEAKLVLSSGHDEKSCIKAVNIKRCYKNSLFYIFKCLLPILTVALLAFHYNITFDYSLLTIVTLRSKHLKV
jgi:hypothetical protein